MKLYGMPGACSLATHIVLEWIGQPYDMQKVSHDEIKQEWYLALNPAGAVPMLEDDGWVLTENIAILNYLADRFPESGLGGDGSPRARAQINRWLGFVNSDLHPAYKPLFGTTAYLEDEAMITRTKDNARQRVRELFAIADARLEGREWIADMRSITDPYLYVLLRWADATGIDLADRTHLAAFRQRMEADPGVQRVLAAEGLS